MDKERRHHRFSVPGARLRGPAFDAPVVNLSKTGLAISTAHELEPGDSYSAWLETGSDRSRLEGRVVWCAPRTPLANEEAAAFEVGLSVQTIDSEQPEAEDSGSGTPESIAARGTISIRSSPRVDVSGMRLRATDLDAEVVNFSSRGLAIRAERALEAGQAYDATLETQDGEVLLQAIVVWSTRREETEEGAPASYAAGLSLRDVDQRLHPLAEDFAPASEEVQSIESPARGESSGPGALSGPDELTGTGDLAPWLAELKEELDVAETKPASPNSTRRRGTTLAILAAVGVAALC